jgi:hypothetical protein
MVSGQGRYRIGHRRRVIAQRQLAESARLGLAESARMRLAEGVRLRLAGSVRPVLAVRPGRAGQAPGQAASHHTGNRGTGQKLARVAPGEISYPVEQVARLAPVEP